MKNWGGDIEAINREISNLEAKIATLESKIPTNAATQDYVDTKVANYLPLEGGNMRGHIHMGNRRIEGLLTPTDSTEAAHKQYVDDNKGDKILIYTMAVSFFVESHSGDSTFQSFPGSFEIPLNKYLGCYFSTEESQMVMLAGRPAQLNNMSNIVAMDITCYNMEYHSVSVYGKCYIVYKQ